MPSQDKFFRKELAKELKNIVNLMKKEPNLEKKMYYYSAAYGITGRTYRYSFSKDILLADFALQGSYKMIIDRIHNLKAGDPTVAIDEKSIDKLEKSLKELADKLEAEENIQGPIEDILTIAFIHSGPGNYLNEKGMI